MIEQKKIEEMLEKVRKPARYIGNEWNCIKKDLKKARLKFALVFPDLYEVGMSHLGFKILYHLLNNEDYIACERVFCPDADLEALLKNYNLPIFSLESKEPLSDFDVIGFSLAHELNYTNALNILRLADIPLKRTDRKENLPLVIAGGPCVFNPEPMSDFIDIFVIGEAEEAILEVTGAVDDFKKSSGPRFNKDELIKNLSRIEGVYAPALYEAGYDSGGALKALCPLYGTVRPVVKKRRVEDLERSFYPAKQIVPYINIVHDRISIEIMRGCPNLCGFCQARVLYHHKRERPLEKILELAEKAVSETGYEEVSLLSLSSGDHSQIEEIIKALVEKFNDRKISVSLPSLRIDKALERLPSVLSRIKKSGLTFAPEAGSARLRAVINKNIDIDLLCSAVKAASGSGWKRVKLYFMIGLPTETYKDIDEIADIIYAVLNVDKAMQVSVSVTPFIPKPHTPFQWEAMEHEEELRAKFLYLKGRIKNKRANLKFHDARMSTLEGVLSRGDRRLGKVILRAFEDGCRFDGWQGRLDFDAWTQAFKKECVEPGFYIYRKKNLQERLPWSHIDCGLAIRPLNTDMHG